jgi:serine/threonine-protein kinase 24/25/MST4
MAPEMILGKTGYNEKADIWSLGITTIEMATGLPPHSNEPPTKVLFTIPKVESPKLEGNFSKELKDFVAQCLNKNPNERPTAKELLKHPCLLKAKPTTILMELIDRYRSFILKHPDRKPSAQWKSHLERFDFLPPPPPLRSDTVLISLLSECTGKSHCIAVIHRQ